MKQKDAATVQEDVNYTFTMTTWRATYRTRSINPTAAADSLP
jgi:hypothetical protein